MEEVEVGEIAEGEAGPREDCASFELGQVEGFSVVADKCAGPLEFFREATHEAAFVDRGGEEELTEVQSGAFKTGDASEKDE